MQFDDAFSETSTRFDARIAAEAEFLLNRSHPEPKIEGHVLEQTWVRKKILEYQRLDPPPELDLGTWASIQVYTQCRSLGESDQEVFARVRALGVLAKEGGVEVDVARAIGRLQLGGRPPGAGSDNRTSTGVMGTPERSASRVAASSPGDAGTTPRIRLPDSPGGEGEAAARDQLLRLISRQVDAVTALAHRVSPDGTADTAVHEPKNMVSNIKYTIDLPILKDADPS